MICEVSYGSGVTVVCYAFLLISDHMYFKLCVVLNMVMDHCRHSRFTIPRYSRDVQISRTVEVCVLNEIIRKERYLGLKDKFVSKDV